MFAQVLGSSSGHAQVPDITLNDKADGYRGIWYMNQPSFDQYVYKYSGGLGTYTAKHRPFAIYCPPVNKTFFCYGGTTDASNTALLHMVSYFDHAAGLLPRPTILLNKQTDDAHDNPVIAVDGAGYIWIFSTSHGTSRPSYIHRSRRPYDIDSFELMAATAKGTSGEQKIPIDNFSYMQVWYRAGSGFLAFFTRYNAPVQRTLYFMQSQDGIAWSRQICLAAIDWGHYQISAAGKNRAGCAFNYHPEGKGLNWRTNLYYMETEDLQRWQSAAAGRITIPLTRADNAALVYDYASEGRNVYLKDMVYDSADRPVILYISSGGYEAGPGNDPRVWTTARWDGSTWLIRPGFTSDNNYDMGSLYLEPDVWRIVAPTGKGPQAYNPGGEMELWESRDQGASWQKRLQLTGNSARNHTYARRPVNVHADFYAFWADGHGRQPSPSNLYFCDAEGNVFMLPRKMQDGYEKPLRINF
jgi:hypothetical protein